MRHLIFLFFCIQAYALPMGNPSEPAMLCDGLCRKGHCGDPCDPFLCWYSTLSVRFGFYGDYVFNRHMEVKHGSDIDRTELNTNAGYLVANFYDRYDIFATFGGTNLHMQSNEKFALLSSTSGEQLILQTDTEFSWSVGGRAMIWECGCTTLGAEAQFFYTKPDVRSIQANSVVFFPDNLSAKYYEWQVGLGVSHRVYILVPYMGIQIAQSHLDFKPNSLPPFTLDTLRSKNLWSYAVGISLLACEKASVTVEGRFAGEKAFYVLGQIRF